jgi:hypothetical protein
MCCENFCSHFLWFDHRIPVIQVIQEWENAGLKVGKQEKAENQRLIFPTHCLGSLIKAEK